MRIALILFVVAIAFVARPAEAADQSAAADVMLPWDVNGGVSLMSPIQAACCKTCRKGKACGDSCIARAKTCRKPPGCACDVPQAHIGPQWDDIQEFRISPRLRGEDTP